MENGETDRDEGGCRSREAKTLSPSASEVAMVYVLGVLLPESQLTRVSAYTSLTLESRATNETNEILVCIDAFLWHRAQNRAPYMRPVPNSRPVSGQRPDPNSTHFNHRIPLLAVHRTARSTRPTR